MEKRNYARKSYSSKMKAAKSVYVILPKIDITAMLKRRRTTTIQEIAETLSRVEESPKVTHSSTQTNFSDVEILSVRKRKLRIKEEPLCPFHSEISIEDGFQPPNDMELDIPERGYTSQEYSASTCRMCNPSLDDNKTDIWEQIGETASAEVEEAVSTTSDGLITSATSTEPYRALVPASRERTVIEMPAQMDKSVQSKSLFSCKFCSCLFSDVLYLKHHKTIHWKMFECVFCNANFRFKNDLKNHIKLHSIPKIFECVYCSQAFTKRMDIKTHLSLHTEESLFRCEQCPAKFNQKAALRGHEKLHKSQFVHWFRKIESPVLEIPAPQKDYTNPPLLSPQQPCTQKTVPWRATVEATTTVMPVVENTNAKHFFSCDSCPLSYRTLKELRKHKTCHTRKTGCHVCASCNAKFVHKRGLTMHEKRAHTSA